MLPKTTHRVALHSSKKANAQIKGSMKERLACFAGATPLQIKKRLGELDKEWDIERALEANGSTLLLAGLILGTWVNRKWYWLPAFVGSFCLQHALQGWCPPIELFRRIGVRTAKEIDEERVALKTLRGDFQKIKRRKSKKPHISEIIEAAHKN